MMRLFFVIILAGSKAFPRQKTINHWVHASIDSVLPGSSWGTGGFTLADYDRDGDPDVFTGEQEDPDQGMKPRMLKERGFFWENHTIVK